MDQLGMLYHNRGQLNKSLNVFQQILANTHSVMNNTDVILHYVRSFSKLFSIFFKITRISYLHLLFNFIQIVVNHYYYYY